MNKHRVGVSVAAMLVAFVFASVAFGSDAARRCPAATGPAYTIGGMTSTKYLLVTSSSGVSCSAALAVLRRVAGQSVGSAQRKLRAPAGWTCYASDVYLTRKATQAVCVKGKLGINWAPRDAVSSGA